MGLPQTQPEEQPKERVPTRPQESVSLSSGEATYTVGSAHLTQSCPELRRRTRGTKIQWDPRNVIREDAMEDERKARSAIMRMYR